MTKKKIEKTEVVVEKSVKSITKNFSGQDLRASDMQNINFVNCDFTDAILQGCNFTGSTFKNCKFDNADTRWAINFNGNE